MYNERNERFSLRDVVLQLLFVALFVFILFWLFPTKNYLDQKIDSLYVDNFSTNIQSMKEAAQDYFTTPRLPQKEGETVKLTLAEMLDLKLLLPFTDKNGDQCDLTKSYVEITKMADEYVMKVNLKCAGMEDYIIVHMGCYDYCLTDICEKEVANGGKTPTKPTTPTKPGKPTDPVKPVVNSYLYLYTKTSVINTPSWGAWSDWSKTAVAKTDKVDVETKVLTEKQQVVEWVITKTTFSTVRESRPNVKIADVQTKTCTAYSQGTTTTTTVVDWVLTEENKFLTIGSVVNTADKIYILKSVPQDGYDCDDSCSIMKGYYDVYTKKTTVSTTGTPAGVCTNYTISVTPVYGTVQLVYEKRQDYKDPFLVTKDVQVTYYRYRNQLSSTTTQTTEQWSESKTDQALINAGFTYTGTSKIK